MRLGAIEAGGTKFVCAVSNESFQVIKRKEFPTETPKKTLAAVCGFFKENPVDAIGIGSFGPIDVNPTSKTYGYITDTPKENWGHYDFLGTMKNQFNIPFAWTTDVNAAAYGEYKLGAAQNKNSCLYLTIGTGIGGGAVVNGQLLQGYTHPEMGHLLVQHHPDDNFTGNCPYHCTCLEGMAAGPAIEKRCNKKAYELAADDPVWNIEAYYLAQAFVDYTLILSPKIIILGGGVMKQNHLLPLIRESFAKQLANYAPVPPLEEYIVPCQLGDNAGITGCLLLAKEQL